MRAEGVIRESDYIRSQYLHLRPRPIFAAIGILILAMLVWSLLVAPSWVVSAATAYLALWFLVFIPWHAKRNYRQYKALSESVSLEVREGGVFFKWSNGEALIPWSHIVKWRHSKTLLLLYPTSNVFHLVPSHFFATSDAFAEFVQVLKDRVGNAR